VDQGRPAKEPEDERPTITSFVNANFNMLTALGIFAALAAFSTTLPIPGAAYFLSFIFLFGTVLIWWELLRGFSARVPTKGGGGALIWFENVMTIGVFALILYWLIAFRTVWRQLLIVPMAAIMMQAVLGVVSYVSKRSNWFNRTFHVQPGELRGLRYWIYALAAVSAFLLCLGVASLLIGPVNQLLDSIRAQLDKPIK
jgi:hypothetical protein